MGSCHSWGEPQKSLSFRPDIAIGNMFDVREGKRGPSIPENEVDGACKAEAGDAGVEGVDEVMKRAWVIWRRDERRRRMSENVECLHSLMFFSLWKMNSES